MTVFQPSSQHDPITRMVLIALIGSVLLGGVALVIFYNTLVNTQHGIADMSHRLKTLQAENAELKDKTFALFTTADLDRIAAEHNLVNDRNPEYLTLEDQWSLASR